MKIRVIRSRLVAGLNTVKDVCKGREQLDILRCIRLETAEGCVVITATDAVTTISATVLCEVDEPGAVCCVGSALVAFSSALAEGELTLSTESKNKVTLTGGSCVFKIAVGRLEDWPKHVAVKTDGALVLQAATLCEIFRKVDYAQPKEQTRKGICGVNVSVKDHRLTAVAVDGRRLSFVEAEVETGEGMSITIPTDTVAIVKRLFAKYEDEVTVASDGDAVSFTAGLTFVQTRLLGVQFPNWRQVLPADKLAVASIDRETFAAELARMALAVGENLCVDFKLKNGALALSAHDSDIKFGSTSMPAKYEGDGITVSLNPHLVLDVLNCIDDTEVEVAFGNGVVPVAIRCSIPFVGVVMPLRKN